GGLHDDLVAGRLGGLLEERHVRVEIPKRRLLLEHESHAAGLAWRAVLRKGGQRRDQQRRQHGGDAPGVIQGERHVSSLVSESGQCESCCKSRCDRRRGVVVNWYRMVPVTS